MWRAPTADWPKPAAPNEVDPEDGAAKDWPEGAKGLLVGLRLGVFPEAPNSMPPIPEDRPNPPVLHFLQAQAHSDSTSRS